MSGERGLGSTTQWLLPNCLKDTTVERLDFDALEAKARSIAATAHRHFVTLVEEPAARL